ncbi:DNA cytosine methyltransferase [Bacillus pumilus]|uniref:Cytosine-specific methyltransferase n=1 Tax=Bacillus pumilus TaxID=1408 RepID=A0AAE4B9P7_BACPU|nr:DNA cytosine methyltransferase [Bacillus pumilus]MDR4250732.1 DNA cytosine methyltransferase [Bacillus pumilus]
MTDVPNHYGYGLRNDGKPFAYKIPDGGNWRNLTEDEQLIYWNGKIPIKGGSTNGLRKRSWDEPAGTITTTPLQKLSCQLHPTEPIERGNKMPVIPNHDPEDKLPTYVQNILDGKSKTNFGKLPINDGTTPARTLLASYATKKPNEIVSRFERREYMGDFIVTPQQPSNGLTVLELFCGGGLGAVGFKAAGFDIVKALDFDKNAVKAYRHNFGDHVEQADISTVEIGSLPNTDVIFGGPPCQDFSVAGKGAGADGDRGKLVWRYLEIISEKQPKAFVFENVKGLLSKRHRPTFDGLLTKFSEIGYEVSWQLINAWDYGVAQKRERVFIVGTRKDLGFKFEFPKPLEGDYRTAVLRGVIGDLPEPSQQDCGKFWTPKREYSYDQANRVQTMSTPSNTIPAHHNSGQPIHPTEAPRRFTVRECLRIQSVPDTYVLPDDISLSAQYRIVGNGIASRVAWYIGVALAHQLKENA